MTVIDIIKDWLRNRKENEPEFSTHDVEISIPEYGKSKYNLFHNPQTYSRKFRLLRELRIIRLEEIPSESREKKFKILEIK